MEICDETVFHHNDSYGFFCLECRLILQFYIEEYAKLTNSLKNRIQDFSLKITKEMQVRYR